MRFSLSTLLLLALWLACALGVWTRHEAWVMGAKKYKQTDLMGIFPDRNWKVFHWMAPDQRRIIGGGFDPYYEILDIQEKTSEKWTLYTFDFLKAGAGEPYSLDFLDNDRLLLGERPYFGADRSEFIYQILYRRYPEWWWGHFYRPEVWVLIGLTLVIAWRGIKRFRMVRATP